MLAWARSTQRVNDVFVDFIARDAETDMMKGEKKKKLENFLF